MDGELRAAEEKLKREHKEMKEAARARIEREKKILANVQAARNRQLPARNASALRPQEMPEGQPASHFFPLKMKSGEEMKVAVRARIQRVTLVMIIKAAQLAARNAAALMTQERRHRELKAREEKDGALDDPGNQEDGDGEDGDGKDEGLLGQSKPDLYVDTARTSKPVLHLDLDAARTSNPDLCLSESAIEDTMRRMNKRSNDDGDDGSIKDVKKVRNQSQPGSRRTYADHEEKSEEEEEESESDNSSHDESSENRI